jgi:hypothetical protein
LAVCRECQIPSNPSNITSFLGRGEGLIFEIWMCCFYHTGNTINLVTTTKCTAFGVIENCSLRERFRRLQARRRTGSFSLIRNEYDFGSIASDAKRCLHPVRLVQNPRAPVSISAALPKGIETIFARADSGFYCWYAVPCPSSFSFPRIRFTSLRRATRR